MSASAIPDVEATRSLPPGPCRRWSEDRSARRWTGLHRIRGRAGEGLLVLAVVGEGYPDLDGLAHVVVGKLVGLVRLPVHIVSAMPDVEAVSVSPACGVPVMVGRPVGAAFWPVSDPSRLPCDQLTVPLGQVYISGSPELNRRLVCGVLVAGAVGS